MANMLLHYHVVRIVCSTKLFGKINLLYYLKCFKNHPYMNDGLSLRQLPRI